MQELLQDPWNSLACLVHVRLGVACKWGMAQQLSDPNIKPVTAPLIVQGLSGGLHSLYLRVGFGVTFRGSWDA